ncbi:unnamed protein product [Amoebophrya sp. A120]|nr:unnamed protein product [Amoebophrya sp. A120]|eukprot:GSA120T00000851001.1
MSAGSGAHHGEAASSSASSSSRPTGSRNGRRGTPPRIMNNNRAVLHATERRRASQDPRRRNSQQRGGHQLLPLRATQRHVEVVAQRRGPRREQTSRSPLPHGQETTRAVLEEDAEPAEVVPEDVGHQAQDNITTTLDLQEAQERGPGVGVASEDIESEDQAQVERGPGVGVASEDIEDLPGRLPGARTAGETENVEDLNENEDNCNFGQQAEAVPLVAHAAPAAPPRGSRGGVEDRAAREVNAAARAADEARVVEVVPPPEQDLAQQREPANVENYDSVDGDDSEDVDFEDDNLLGDFYELAGDYMTDEEEDDSEEEALEGGALFRPPGGGGPRLRVLHEDHDGEFVLQQLGLGAGRANLAPPRPGVNAQEHRARVFEEQVRMVQALMAAGGQDEEEDEEQGGRGPADQGQADEEELLHEEAEEQEPEQHELQPDGPQTIRLSWTEPSFLWNLRLLQPGFVKDGQTIILRKMKKSSKRTSVRGPAAGPLGPRGTIEDETAHRGPNKEKELADGKDGRDHRELHGQMKSSISQPHPSSSSSSNKRAREQVLETATTRNREPALDNDDDASNGKKNDVRSSNVDVLHDKEQEVLRDNKCLFGPEILLNGDDPAAARFLAVQRPETLAALRTLKKKDDEQYGQDVILDRDAVQVIDKTWEQSIQDSKIIMEKIRMNTEIHQPVPEENWNAVAEENGRKQTERTTTSRMSPACSLRRQISTNLKSLGVRLVEGRNGPCINSLVRDECRNLVFCLCFSTIEVFLMVGKKRKNKDPGGVASTTTVSAGATSCTSQEKAVVKSDLPPTTSTKVLTSTTALETSRASNHHDVVDTSEVISGTLNDLTRTLFQSTFPTLSEQQSEKEYQKLVLETEEKKLLTPDFNHNACFELQKVTTLHPLGPLPPGKQLGRAPRLNNVVLARDLHIAEDEIREPRLVLSDPYTYLMRARGLPQNSRKRDCLVCTHDDGVSFFDLDEVLEHVLEAKKAAEEEEEKAEILKGKINVICSRSSSSSAGLSTNKVTSFQPPPRTMMNRKSSKTSSLLHQYPIPLAYRWTGEVEWLLDPMAPARVHAANNENAFFSSHLATPAWGLSYNHNTLCVGCNDHVVRVWDPTHQAFVRYDGRSLIPEEDFRIGSHRFWWQRGPELTEDAASEKRNALKEALRRAAPNEPRISTWNLRTRKPDLVDHAKAKMQPKSFNKAFVFEPYVTLKEVTLAPIVLPGREGEDDDESRSSTTTSKSMTETTFKISPLRWRKLAQRQEENGGIHRPRWPVDIYVLKKWHDGSVEVEGKGKELELTESDNEDTPLEQKMGDVGEPAEVLRDHPPAPKIPVGAVDKSSTAISSWSSTAKATNANSGQDQQQLQENKSSNAQLQPLKGDPMKIELPKRTRVVRSEHDILEIFKKTPNLDLRQYTDNPSYYATNDGSFILRGVVCDPRRSTAESETPGQQQQLPLKKTADTEYPKMEFFYEKSDDPIPAFPDGSSLADVLPMTETEKTYLRTGREVVNSRVWWDRENLSKVTTCEQGNRGNVPSVQASTILNSEGNAKYLYTAGLDGRIMRFTQHSRRVQNLTHIFDARTAEQGQGRANVITRPPALFVPLNNSRSTSSTTAESSSNPLGMATMILNSNTDYTGGVIDHQRKIGNENDLKNNLLDLQNENEQDVESGGPLVPDNRLWPLYETIVPNRADQHPHVPHLTRTPFFSELLCRFPKTERPLAYPSKILSRHSPDIYFSAKKNPVQRVRTNANLADYGSEMRRDLAQPVETSLGSLLNRYLMFWYVVVVNLSDIPTISSAEAEQMVEMKSSGKKEERAGCCTDEGKMPKPTRTRDDLHVGRSPSQEGEIFAADSVAMNSSSAAVSSSSPSSPSDREVVRNAAANFEAKRLLTNQKKGHQGVKKHTTPPEVAVATRVSSSVAAASQRNSSVSPKRSRAEFEGEEASMSSEEDERRPEVQAQLLASLSFNQGRQRTDGAAAKESGLQQCSTSSTFLMSSKVCDQRASDLVVDGRKNTTAEMLNNSSFSINPKSCNKTTEVKGKSRTSAKRVKSNNRDSPLLGDLFSSSSSAALGSVDSKGQLQGEPLQPQPSATSTTHRSNHELELYYEPMEEVSAEEENHDQADQQEVQFSAASLTGNTTNLKEEHQNSEVDHEENNMEVEDVVPLSNYVTPRDHDFVPPAPAAGKEQNLVEQSAVSSLATSSSSSGDDDSNHTEDDVVVHRNVEIKSSRSGEISSEVDENSGSSSVDEDNFSLSEEQMDDEMDLDSDGTSSRGGSEDSRPWEARLNDPMRFERDVGEGDDVDHTNVPFLSRAEKDRAQYRKDLLIASMTPHGQFPVPELRKEMFEKYSKTSKMKPLYRKMSCKNNRTTHEQSRTSCSKLLFKRAAKQKTLYPIIRRCPAPKHPDFALSEEERAKMTDVSLQFWNAAWRQMRQVWSAKGGKNRTTRGGSWNKEGYNNNFPDTNTETDTPSVDLPAQIMVNCLKFLTATEIIFSIRPLARGYPELAEYVISSNRTEEVVLGFTGDSEIAVLRAVQPRYCLEAMEERRAELMFLRKVNYDSTNGKSSAEDSVLSTSKMMLQSPLGKLLAGRSCSSTAELNKLGKNVDRRSTAAGGMKKKETKKSEKDGYPSSSSSSSRRPQGETYTTPNESEAGQESISSSGEGDDEKNRLRVDDDEKIEGHGDETTENVEELHLDQILPTNNIIEPTDSIVKNSPEDVAAFTASKNKPRFNAQFMTASVHKNFVVIADKKQPSVGPLVVQLHRLRGTNRVFCTLHYSAFSSQVELHENYDDESLRTPADYKDEQQAKNYVGAPRPAEFPSQILVKNYHSSFSATWGLTAPDESGTMLALRKVGMNSARGGRNLARGYIDRYLAREQDDDEEQEAFWERNNVYIDTVVLPRVE